MYSTPSVPIGSGFPLILKAWQEKQWPKPELVDDPDILQVKMTLKIPENVLKESGNVLKDVLKDVPKDVPKELSERQIVIINLIRENIHLTAKEMSYKLSVSLKTIQRELAILIEKGILVRVKGRKNGHWEILGYN
jgi:predicted HTH transcriptional regulator